MIIGIGVDVVDLARFERATTRTPGVLTRLFAESDQGDGAARRSVSARAARAGAGGLRGWGLWWGVHDPILFDHIFESKAPRPRGFSTGPAPAV